MAVYSDSIVVEVPDTERLPPPANGKGPGELPGARVRFPPKEREEPVGMKIVPLPLSVCGSDP